MKLTRRNFLAWAGLGAVGAVACEGFGIRSGELNIQSPVRLPEDLVRGSDNWYASLCRICPSCEGIVVRVMEGRAKMVQGNPYYPTNQGKIHARCEAGLQALYHPDRIPTAMRRSGPRGSGEFMPVNWQPNGMDTLKDVLRANGSSSVMITEPLRGHMALLADRFAKAIGGERLGFEAIDNNTLRAAVKNVFQQDSLPDFDLDNSKFILSFGADFLSTWVSPTRFNRGYGEFRQGEGRDRGMFYQVDSRFSMTAANADKWLPVRPGWEGYLALSLAQVIVAEGLQDDSIDVASFVGGDSGIQVLKTFRPEVVAPLAGLTSEMTGGNPVEFLKNLARSFAANRPSIAIGGGSAGAQSNGLFNLEAIYGLNFLVGSVGKKGGIRFNPPSPWADVPSASTAGSPSAATPPTSPARVTNQVRPTGSTATDTTQAPAGRTRARSTARWVTTAGSSAPSVVVTCSSRRSPVATTNSSSAPAAGRTSAHGSGNEAVATGRRVRGSSTFSRAPERLVHSASSRSWVSGSRWPQCSAPYQPESTSTDSPNGPGRSGTSAVTGRGWGLNGRPV